MSLTAAILAVPVRTLPVGGAPPPTQTILQLMDAIAGGPEYHWRMADASSASMAARIGGVAGAWVNPTNLEFGIDPLTTNAASGKCVAFGAATGTPGHGTVTLGGAGISIASQHTIHQCIQVDLHRAKHVCVTTGGGTVAGQFSREFIDDGAGGLKPRVWTVNATGVATVWVGAANGTVPIGEAFSVDWIQQNGSLAVRINGVDVQLVLDAGTPPATWAVPPAGTLYLGTFSNMTASFDGLMSEVAIWNSYVFTQANSLSLSTPQNVVWLRDFDAGSVNVNTTIDIPLAPHAHPASGFTPSVVSDPPPPSIVTVNGEQIQFQAGATPVTNDTFTINITKDSITSPARTVTIDVTAVAPIVALPYFGQYYGNGYCGPGGASNTICRVASDNGISFFFYAERNGTIDRITFQRRTDTASGYSAGTGGTYTIEIRRANTQTHLPIPLAQGGQVISQLNGWVAGNPPGAGGTQYFTLTFTSTPGQTIAKQGYCLIFRNTHANPINNFFSTNISMQAAWAGSIGSGHPAPPAQYEEPAETFGVNPMNPGTSVAAVRGWSPIYIDGVEWYRWPDKAYNGDFQYNRLGPEHASLRYSDGQWLLFGVFPIGSVPAGTVRFNNPQIQARERFRVTRASRTVSGVFMRLARLSGSTGTLTVRLESGPAGDAHLAGNGSPMVTVTVPHTVIYNVGPTEDPSHYQNDNVTPFDIPHYIWVPFPTPQLLAIGQNYNLRLSISSGLDIQMRCTGRVDQGSTGLGPRGATIATWSAWETQRNLPWTAWEDSRGFQTSSDGGVNWVYGGNAATSLLSPIVFKCV
jgi:hypothetical protein